MKPLLSLALFLAAGPAAAQHPQFVVPFAAPSAPVQPVKEKEAPPPIPKAAADPKLPRGLKGASPAAKILNSPRFTPKRDLTAVPAQFSVVPPQLRMWGNNQYGCCVSSEEAFALTDWTFRCAGKAVLPTDAEVVSFARQYGYLNGAWLTEVMDTMQTHGMKVGGQTYKIGPYSSVDYTRPDDLKEAIYAGPVNIAIDADALPSGAGNANGWYATRGVHYSTNHCVSLAAYGPADYLYSTLGVPLPAALPPATQGYLLFTWSTLGFVTQDWLNSTCREAWVRVPTTVGFSPPTPNPDPVPPTPTPPAPVPPGPVPSGGDYTRVTTEVYKDGKLIDSRSVIGASSATLTLEADLKAAGINPVLIADVLRILQAVRIKDPEQRRAAVMAAVLQLMLDMGLGEPQPAMRGLVPPIVPQ